jgi:CBS domain containing-hemolysin-like protein
MIWEGSSRDEALQIARKNNVSILPVYDPEKTKLVGYVRLVDLVLSKDERVVAKHPVATFAAADALVTVLIRMQSEKQEMACVSNRDGKTIGLVTSDRLIEPLFSQS